MTAGSRAATAGRGHSLAVHVPRDRRAALSSGGALPLDTVGAVLFGDVSGFTPLTEMLARVHGPRLGAERLTEVLDRVLGVLIEEIERADGSVVYFSGDAITVWLDGDDGSTAVACADAMQDAMGAVATIEDGGESTTLGLKVAVATGRVRRFVVGEPSFRLIDVLAGEPLDTVAAAESVARPGDVVVTAAVADALAPPRLVGADEVSDDLVRLGPSPSAPSPAGSRAAPMPVADELAAPWVERRLRERLSSGDGALVAELRNVVPLFVDLAGLDFVGRGAPARVDVFLSAVQRTLDAHGGSLQTLTVGDKGAYVFGVFGTPVAHEDDPARAVAAGLRIVALADEQGVDGVRIGIARGQVFSGVQGHPSRRTFVCLGDPVNLAARTMGVAEPGEVLVTPEVAHELGEGAVVVSRAPAPLKGRRDLVALSAVTGLTAASLRGAGLDRTPFTGRDQELDALLSRFGRARTRGVAVVGSAGLGKSRLVRELVVRLEADGRRAVHGRTRGFGASAPYQAWHAVWRDLLGVDPEDPERDIRATVERIVATVDPRLVPRAPLLGPLLGVDLADSDLTRGMDPRVAKDSREGLAVRLLSGLEGPVRVIVLDDAHAADALSLDLAAAVMRAGADVEDVVVLAGRPPTGSTDDVDRARDVAAVPGIDHVVTLAALHPDDVETLLDHHCTLRLGAPDAMHPAVRRAVTERAQGNPLTIAELVRALHEQDVDPATPEAAAVELPASLEALVLGRVDRLPERTRRVVKVGSLMLAGFGADTLVEVHPDLGTVEEVEHAIVPAVGELLAVRPDGGYDLRHALTREVAYASLPQRLRTRLHAGVAARLERRHGDAVETVVDELAHHAWFGETERRERWTALAAGRASAAYANDAALRHLDRLTSVATGQPLVDGLLDRADVLTLVGRLPEAREDQQRALEVGVAADDPVWRARALTALAETSRRSSELDEAVALLREADALLTGDTDRAARARVLHLTGTVCAMRGDLEGAEVAYRDALAIREDLDDVAGRAALLSNLGIVAEYEGDLTAAEARHASALALREELGDPWAIANSRTNLGMIALLSDDATTARDHFEAALTANVEVGDPWHAALGRQNLGNALRDLGEHDAAASHYVDAARHFVGVEDDWALALLLEDAARLAVAAGAELRAAELLGGADAIRDSLDAPRASALEEAVIVTLATATSVAGRAAVDAAVARGRALGRTDIIDALRDVVTSRPAV